MAKAKNKSEGDASGASTTDWSTSNRMHLRLFLVLSYHDQLSIEADFASTGARKLSSLPYWKSLSGHAFQEEAAKAQAGRTTGQMIKGYSLVPKAGVSKRDWSQAYKEIEATMVAATSSTVAGLGSKFDELYQKDAQ